MGEVSITQDVVFGGTRLGLIAGPCVIESREHSLRMAEAVAAEARARSLPFVFKSSFDKANRTAMESYRGPGPDEGLRILEEVAREVGVPTLTDVHERGQVEEAAAVVDVLQIPAFLCRQTDLVVAAAATGRPVNLKKGQFLAPWDMQRVVQKAEATGNRKLLITERGASFGYNNLVVDIKGLPILAALGYPVVLDVTHSLQRPGGEGHRTGGEPEYAVPLASAGVAAGVDVLFIEVHDRPQDALSDATTQLPLERLGTLLDRARRIRDAIVEA